MAIEYCNVNSDLVSVYRPIEEYKNLKTLTGWELVSGNVYKKDQAGFVEMVYEDGVPLTQGNSTTPAAGEFYYKASTDTLYLQCTDSADPATHTIESGLDWDAFKQRCRNDAQEMLEAWLRSVYATPFQKVIAPGQSYNARDYDYIIRRATALLTCYLIVSHTNSEDPAAEKLYKQVFHEPQFEGDQPGIVQQLLSGKMTLRTQRSAREPGSFNVYEGANNSSTAYVEVTGTYSGANKEVWRLQIDNGGAPGTATYKLSYDQGATWDLEGQPTRPSSDGRRVRIGNDIWVEFVGTFTVGDYWDIELFPSTDALVIQPVGAFKLER